MSQKRTKRMHGHTERAVYFRVGGLHVESNFQNLLAALNCSLILLTDLVWKCSLVSGLGLSVQRRHSSAISTAVASLGLWVSAKYIHSAHTFFAFLGHFRFLMGIIKVSRWIGLKILHLKHP